MTLTEYRNTIRNGIKAYEGGKYASRAYVKDVLTYDRTLPNLDTRMGQHESHNGDFQKLSKALNDRSNLREGIRWAVYVYERSTPHYEGELLDTIEIDL